MVGVTDMGGEELRSRLLAFDRAVALLHPGRSFRLVLVGGGAMVLLGCLARATSDLDVLVFPPELASLMTQFDLNGRVRAWEDHFACNIEDRLVPIDVSTTVVACYSASLEDLIVSKLHSTRPKDAQDIRRPEVLKALDWDRLADAVADTEGSVLIERRHRDFLADYASYRKECGPCAG